MTKSVVGTGTFQRSEDVIRLAATPRHLIGAEHQTLPNGRLLNIVTSFKSGIAT